MLRFAILVIVALAGAGPAFTETAPPPLDQPKHDTNQHNTAPDNRGTEAVPLIIKELPRERSEEDKAEAQEKSALDRKLTEYTGNLAFYTKYLFLATLVLAALTGALAVAAFLQMRDARKSIDAAVISAKAAKDAAEALPILERAFVLMYPDIQPSITRTLGPAGKRRIDEIMTGFLLINHGRTHAIVKSISFGVSLVDDLTTIPRYSDSVIDWDVVIPGGGRYPEKTTVSAIEPPEKYEKITYFHHNILTIEISAAQSDQILAKKLFPLVLGRAAYVDIFGKRYEIGDCFIYNGRTGFFEQHGGQEYNYWREC